MVPAAASAWSGGESVTGVAGSELAYTGSTLATARWGLVVLAAGLGLMVLARRRAAVLG